MIRIFLGNIGSGKTACAVREMALDQRRILTYSNIKTTLAWQHDLTPDKIIQKTIIDTKTNKKTNEQTPIYEYTVNMDFWTNIKEPLNIVLDEAHSILNSRRAMKSQNIIFNDWLALVRKILTNRDHASGNLTFITQLSNRLDVVARDMATHIRYHICHYFKTCTNCKCQWNESSDMPEIYDACPSCHGINLKKHNFIIEVFHFNSINSYHAWSIEGMKTFHKHYTIDDIEEYFGIYDTFQIDNLF
jgi:hypothetical protein